MVQVDLPAAFATGQLFSLLSSRYLEKEPKIFTNGLLGPLNFYLTCGLAPAGLYLLIGYPSWEVMYLTDWVERPFDRPLVAGFYVVFLMLIVFLGNVGFTLGHHWLRLGRYRWVLWGTILGYVATVTPFLLRWGVWFKVGTYQEFLDGNGYSFWSPPFFTGWLVVMSYMVVASVVTGLWFLKQGRLADR
jgi:hypothetical protein